LIAFGAVGLLRAWREAPAERGGAERGGAETGGAATGAPNAGPVPWEPPRPEPLGRMLTGGLVLSGDNLAAGFALGAYHVSVVVAAAVFGVVSVAMSLAGLELGARIGAAAGERSELIACALLIVVGVVIAAGAL
jgi:hypothetical protein